MEQTQDFVFFGATRFEAPPVGHTFRRDGQKVFQVVGVKTLKLRTDPEEFVPLAWKFVANCRELRAEELRKLGKTWAPNS